MRRRISERYRKLAVIGQRTLVVALVEAFLIVLAALSAFVLRLGRLPNWHVFATGTALLVAVRLLYLWRYNLLRGWWRYTGFNQMLDLVKATVLGTLTFFFGHELWSRLSGAPIWPWSIYLLEPGATILLLGAGRGAARLLAGAADGCHQDNAIRLVLIGAGDAARRILHELRKAGSGYQVLGCVDDDPSKAGIPIGGVKVEGAIDDLPEIARQLNANEVWIAIPTATTAQMHRIVRLCLETKLPYKSLPRLRDIVNGNVVPQMREVSVNDLLGREPVIADLKDVREKIQNRRVMVTGAAGSIGSELCRQLLQYEPAELVCVDQAETPMFYLQLRQPRRDRTVPVTYCVANVANASRMQRILREHRIEIIFHAAAYKHVPVMEANVSEAIYNNVTALQMLLATAERCNVKSFVLISSDKAVKPTNVMGTTKRIGELIIASRPRTRMECVAVRFGNVLGSNGSVVPVFLEQIRKHNEVTITHPEIKRYFMTAGEAASLVLQAFTVGEHRDVLVLDMGEPIPIVELAKNLIRLCGKTEKDVRIRYIGLREGEKLKEELFYESEEVWPTTCTKVLRTRTAVKSWSELSYLLQELEFLLQTGTDDQLRAAMKEIVPEFTYEPTLAGRREPRSRRQELASVQSIHAPASPNTVQ